MSLSSGTETYFRHIPLPRFTKSAKEAIETKINRIDALIQDIDQLIEEAIPKSVSLTQSERVKRRLEILLDANTPIKEPLKVK